MAVSASFLEGLRDVLAAAPALHWKRMFGGAGVYSGETMFAIAMDDTLYLKSDAESAPAFEARGLSAFLYRDRTGRELEMSYRQAPEEIWEDPDEARAWVARALGAAARQAAAKPARRRKA